jgi:hypothetical protein
MKNYKKKIIIYVIAFIICGIIAYLLYTFLNNDTETDKKNENNLEEYNYYPAANERQDVFEDRLLGVEINKTLFILELEDTETAKDLLYMSPFSLIMEKDNNSLKGYLKTSLSINSSYINKAKSGDLMLFNNNCLVLFNKETVLDDNYILIGHINDLEIPNNNQLEVSFVR